MKTITTLCLMLITVSVFAAEPKQPCPMFGLGDSTDVQQQCIDGVCYPTVQSSFGMVETSVTVPVIQNVTRTVEVPVQRVVTVMEKQTVTVPQVQYVQQKVQTAVPAYTDTFDPCSVQMNTKVVRTGLLRGFFQNIRQRRQTRFQNRQMRFNTRFTRRMMNTQFCN